MDKKTLSQTLITKIILFTMTACCFDTGVSFLYHVINESILHIPTSVGSFFFNLVPCHQKVTNAQVSGKRADIVFYGVTFEALLFF